MLQTYLSATLNNRNDCFILQHLQMRAPINSPAYLLQPQGYLRLNTRPALDSRERSAEDAARDICAATATVYLFT